MNSTALATLAATGLTVAIFHAAIPTHWIPFVLVARARGWARSKTLLVAGAASLGHVLITSLLGLAVAWFGFMIEEELGHVFPYLSGGVLLAIGGYYLWRQWRGKGICHHPTPGSHHHASEACGHEEGEGHTHWAHELEDNALTSGRSSDWAAIGGLLAMLTFSPCEAFLPVYLSGVEFGWTGFAVLSVILAAGTLGTMILFTWLALLGVERLKIKSFERREAGLLGLLFCVLGVLMLLWRHQH